MYRISYYIERSSFLIFTICFRARTNHTVKFVARKEIKKQGKTKHAFLAVRIAVDARRTIKLLQLKFVSHLSFRKRML